MLDVTTGIRSLTDFKRNTVEFSRWIKETGQPLVLTVNGKADLVVLDAASYQALVEAAGRRGGIESIARQGREPVSAPRELPAPDEEDSGAFAGFRGQGAAGAADIEVD